MAMAIPGLFMMRKVFAAHPRCLVSPSRSSSSVLVVDPCPLDEPSLAVAEKAVAGGVVVDGGEPAAGKVCGKGPRRRRSNGGSAACLESLRSPMERLAVEGMDKEQLRPVAARRRDGQGQALASPSLVVVDPCPLDEPSLAVAEKAAGGVVDDGGERVAEKMGGKGLRRRRSKGDRGACHESLRAPMERLAAEGMDKDKLCPVAVCCRDGGGQALASPSLVVNPCSLDEPSLAIAEKSTGGVVEDGRERAVEKAGRKGLRRRRSNGDRTACLESLRVPMVQLGAERIDKDKLWPVEALHRDGRGQALASPSLVVVDPCPLDEPSIAVAEKAAGGVVELGGERAAEEVGGKGPRNKRSSGDQAVCFESLRAPMERIVAAGMDMDKLWSVTAHHRNPEKWLANLEFLLQRGLSPSQVEEFFGSGDVYVTEVKLTSILNFLDSLDPSPSPSPSETLAAKLLARFPLVLNISVKTMKDRVKFLVDQGFNTAQIRAMLLLHPTLLGLDVQSFLDHILFFEDLGLTREKTIKVLRRFPHLFSLSIEKRLKPFFDSLEERGLAKEDALKFLVRRTPSAIHFSALAVSDRIKFLQEKLGLEEKSRPLTKALFVLSSYGIPLLEERADWFLSQGLTKTELQAMIRIHPDVIASPTKKVVAISAYIKQYLNFDLNALIRVPIIFSMSPEKRILPRCQIIADIKETKLLKKKISLGSIFLTTDDAFRKYVSSLTK